MSNGTAPVFMAFSDGINTQLSPIPTMTAAMSEIPDWIRTSVMPNAHADVQPLLDIYAAVMELHTRLNHIEAEQQIQSLALAELLEASRRRPFTRLMRWLHDMFTFTHTPKEQS